MEKKMLEKIAKNIISVIGIIIMIVITLMSVFYIAEVKNFAENVEIKNVTSLNLFIYIMIDLLMVILLRAIDRNKFFNGKFNWIWKALIILIYILVSIWWINVAKIEPVDDSKAVNDIAIEIAKGNNSKLYENNYIEKCPHQIGMVLIFSSLYKIFNTTNYILIQYINILANIISIIVIGQITKEISTKYHTNINISMILTITFLPLILLETYVYGDYLGLAFSLCGIYSIIMYKKTNKVYNFIFSMLCMLFAYAVKMNYIIVTISIVIYLVMYIIAEKKQKKVVREVILIIIYICISILPFNILKNWLGAKCDYDKKQALPTSMYLYIGMSESYRANGWYSDVANDGWVDTPNSYESYPIKIKERIYYFLKNPKYMFYFYWNKTISGWEDPYFQSVWYNVGIENKNEVLENIIHSRLYKIGQYYQKSITILIYGSALIATVKNRKKINNELMLLIVIFIGGILFHTLWEMKSRYTMPYVIMLIPVASIGVQEIINKLDDIKLKKIGEKKDEKDKHNSSSI